MTAVSPFKPEHFQRIDEDPDERFYDIVGIANHKEDVVGLIWYGYPKVTPSQQRASVDEVLSELP